MKKIYFSLLVTALLVKAGTANAQAGSVALRPSSGPQVLYASVTAAYAAIPAAPASGYIIELLPAYNGTDASEVYPIVFSDKGIAPGGPVTITIRPAAGNNGEIIQRPTPAFGPTVSFDGGDNVILDGRPGGVASVATNYLTVNQLFTSATTPPTGTLFRNIDFVNAANNNTVQFVNAVSAAANATTGAQGIVIGSTTTTGNNNNKIQNNIISGGSRCIQDFGLSNAVPNNATIIQSNTVKDFSGIGIFAGIQTNITIAGNTIQVNGTALLGTSLEGIRQQAPTGTGTITDNTISLVTTSTTIATLQGFINVGTGAENILRNTITAISAPNATTLRGFNFNNTGVGITVNVSNNAIRNLTGAASTSTIGIAFAGTSNQTISNNIISNLTASTSVQGISQSSTAATTTTINANAINDLSASGAGNIRGIAVFPFTASTINTSNNAISITQGNASAAAIFGMLFGNTAGNNYTSNIYFNTVRIGGTGSTTSVTAYGIFKSDANATSVYNQKNNILVMDRDGSVGFFNGSNTGTLAIDYNNYYATGTTGSFAASVNNINYANADLALYKAAATPQEQNSTFNAVNFVSLTNLHLTGSSVTDVTLKGTPVAGITTDFDGNTRSATTPTKGADEPGLPLPISLYTFTGTNKGSYNQLAWSTVSENNNAGFELQRSADGKNFTSLNYVKSQAANGNSTTLLHYTFNDVKPFVSSSFYRLKQSDKNGLSTYSPIVTIKGKGTATLQITNLYPNPVVSKFSIIAEATSNSRISIIITDVQGKPVMQKNMSLVAGHNVLELNAAALASGMYTIKAVENITGQTATLKFVK